MAGRIRRLLVANRGEIAVRVIARAGARPENRRVHSEADRDSLPVRLANVVVPIGRRRRPELSERRRVLRLPPIRGRPIHPGYGFFRERGFRRSGRGGGLVFVGRRRVHPHHGNKSLAERPRQAGIAASRAARACRSGRRGSRDRHADRLSVMIKASAAEVGRASASRATRRTAQAMGVAQAEAQSPRRPPGLRRAIHRRRATWSPDPGRRKTRSPVRARVLAAAPRQKILEELRRLRCRRRRASRLCTSAVRLAKTVGSGAERSSTCTTTPRASSTSSR